MGTYVAVADIPPRIGNRAIGSTTSPSSTDVGAWIDEAEAEIAGTLAGQGIETTYMSGTRGFKILRNWIASYVAGLVRVSHAAAGGDGSNDDGRELVEDWHGILRRIRTEPDAVSAMLDASGNAASGTIRLQSYTTSNADSKVEADLAPTFERFGENF